MTDKEPIKESERDSLKLKSNEKLSENNSPNLQQNQINSESKVVINQLNPNANPIPSAPIMPLVVNNDIQGFVPILKPNHFGSKPVGTYCPNCRFPVTTVSMKKCNCCSFCFCCFCFQFWLFIQCCRKKEITCYDYEHRCPRCGFNIGNYDAW